MAIGDVWKITLNALYLGQVNQNSLTFRMKTAPDPDATKLLAVANDIKELLRPGQSNLYTYQTYKASQERGGTVTYPDGECKKVGGIGFDGNLTGTLVGGNPAAELLPPQSALVTTLKSDFIGRAKRGRLYMGGLTEGDQNAGAWTTALLSAADARWVTFMAKYASPTGTDPDFELGIWSFRTATGCVRNPAGDLVHEDPASPATAFTFVTQHLLRSTVYTQRRRVIGRGM